MLRCAIIGASGASGSSRSGSGDVVSFVEVESVDESFEFCIMVYVGVPGRRDVVGDGCGMEFDKEVVDEGGAGTTVAGETPAEEKAEGSFVDVDVEAGGITGVLGWVG